MSGVGFGLGCVSDGVMVRCGGRSYSRNGFPGVEVAFGVAGVFGKSFVAC